MSAVAQIAKRAPRPPGFHATCGSHEVGIANALEFAFLFLQWAGSLATPLSPELIQQRFGCSRATAYRWRNAYLAMQARVAQP